MNALEMSSHLVLRTHSIRLKTLGHYRSVVTSTLFVRYKELSQWIGFLGQRLELGVTILRPRIGITYPGN